MSHATERLDMAWKSEHPCGRIYECFLLGHNRLVRISLPFLPDLHNEMRKSGGKPNSDVERMQECGYASMPLIGVASALKTLSLLTKPLCVTSQLNGRAHMAAAQAGTALHMMAYQTDLLKDLDQVL